MPLEGGLEAGVSHFPIYEDFVFLQGKIGTAGKILVARWTILTVVEGQRVTFARQKYHDPSIKELAVTPLRTKATPQRNFQHFNIYHIHFQIAT